jgi:putative addiction module CopG family antidote
MNIELKPELEMLIRQDVERGAYGSVADFVEQAVQLLHAQEEWLAEHRAEISRLIEDGYAAAQRGELMTADQVRAGTKKAGMDQ